MNLVNIQDQEIKELAKKLHNIKKYGSNKETISNILEFLIPKTSNIKYKVSDNAYPACFNIDEETVEVSPNKLNKIIINSVAYLKTIFPNINKEEMFYYYIVYALSHEIRHVNQYLIGNKLIKCPYQIIVEVYNTLSNIGNLDINPFRNFISECQYNLYNDRLVIERNACIEASEIIRNLARYEENEPIAELFESLRQKNITYGYDDKYNGSIEQTYKRISLKKLYEALPKGEAIPIRDRILYGLPINEETKKKVLAHKY